MTFCPPLSTVPLNIGYLPERDLPDVLVIVLSLYSNVVVLTPNFFLAQDSSCVSYAPRDVSIVNVGKTQACPTDSIYPSEFTIK